VGPRRLRLLVLALAVCGVLAAFVLTPVASAAAGDFVFTGRGYGHAEGMSQWGAWAAAMEGVKYDAILAFYFPETTVTKASPTQMVKARTLVITGTAGSTTMPARTFKSKLGLKSTLILSIARTVTTTRHEQTDSHLKYAGTWYTFSKTGPSGGSYKRASSNSSSCTVTFTGTYLAWIATAGTNL
jgi:cytochrome oxidase assembly protein ShyY1